MTKNIIDELVNELALEESDSLKARAKEGLRILGTKSRIVRIEFAKQQAKQNKIMECRDMILKAYADGDEAELERVLKLEL